jgi:hypothetical protein
MNAITIEAIKLLLSMLEVAKEEEKQRLSKMVESLVCIMEKDIEQAFQRYASVKLV